MTSHNELIYLDIVTALKGLRKKEYRAQELVAAHIDQMGKTSHLNAYITPLQEQAFKAAKLSDSLIAQGQARPLEGIPIAMKDVYCTKGILTTAASKMLGNFIPPYESTVSQKLQDAGAILLGKTNMDEFAMGSANVHSAYGASLSPWKAPSGEHCSPGGSSGGSAAAVASFSAMAATGTDTGGSVRQPASFCGIVGLKPTYGRCSRFGMIAFASSLDQAGPFARTVEDSALMLQHMAGFDRKDATSIDKPVPCYREEMKGSLRGLRVGIPRECQSNDMRADVSALWQKAAQVLRDAGAEVQEIFLPMLKYALPTYYIIATAEASSNLARYDGVRFGLRVEGESLDDLYMKTRCAGFGAEVKRRIFMGTHVLSAGYYDAYYVKAQKMRARIIKDFRSVFQEVNLILTPSSPTPPFIAGQEPKDPVTMYMSDIYTVIANLAGLPGMSIPMGLSFDEKLPLGMQLLAPAFEESLLLKAGQALFDAAQKNPTQALREI